MTVKRTITMNLTEKDAKIFNRIVDEKQLGNSLGQSQILQYMMYDYYRLITGDTSVEYQPYRLNCHYTEKERRRFGNRLYQYRTHSHLSQEELAKRLNVSSSSISLWESGSIPHFNCLKKIANELNCSVKDLFKGEEKNARKTN